MTRYRKLGPPYLAATFPMNIMHGSQTQPRHVELEGFEAADDDGDSWWLFEPREAAKFDRAFAGWTLLWPRGDEGPQLPRKLIRGDVELTWDGERWSGVPPDDKDAAIVMRAAWFGSIPIGRPRLDEDDLRVREEAVLDAIRSAPDDLPTRDAIASRMGWMTTTGPDYTFRETVRRLGNWEAAVKQAKDLER